MKTTAEANADLTERRGGVSQGTFDPSSVPDTLIRTIGGRITSWPAGMQRRYGFTSEQAVGSISHELLHTIFPRPLDDIEAALLAHNAWSGGVVHRHADGRAVTTTGHWGLFRTDADGEAIVIEMHSSAASPELADLLAIFANEISQPLTAIANYISGARRILRNRWADQRLAREAMTLADMQVVRGADQVRLLRRLVNDLRANG